MSVLWGRFVRLPAVVSLPILIAALVLLAVLTRGVVQSLTRPDEPPPPPAGKVCDDLFDPRCDPERFRNPQPGG